MKQLKFREPFKVSLPDDLYRELLELYGQGDMQDAPFQDFVAVLLRISARMEKQMIDWEKRLVVGHKPAQRGPSPRCVIIDLDQWRQRHDRG